MPDPLPGDERHTALVSLHGVVKDYQALRPLRIQALTITRGDGVALLGFDAPMAEVLVNLITAGSLPDEGEVLVFGESTRAITDHASWMKVIDRFGLISQRSVLLDHLTAEQNLALPFELAVESLDDEVRQRVRRLADEIALPSSHLSQPVAALPPASQLRVRLGRALALEPDVVLAEHPNAVVSKDEARAFAADLARIRGDRRLASLVMTADTSFAEVAGTDIRTLQPATGELEPSASWRRRWFG
jgi:predicted ABC-type transport system involved in lysophospholipase L1 biosynthesis ATPase subunit